MNQTMNLNGMWELGYCELDCGIRPPYTMHCPVPGDVHMALIDAGIIPEPLIDENTHDCHFLETKEFWYRRVFSFDTAPLPAKSILTFHGLDCTADIWLNEIYLGRHNNAFVEAEYDVSTWLRSGENTLVVRIDSGVAEAKTHPIDDMGKMWNNDQPYRVLMRKPQFVYGWDWTPWLETCGIWRDVTLTSYDTAAITDIYIHQPDNAVPVEGETIAIEADLTLDIVCPGSYSLSAVVYGDERYDSADPTICGDTSHSTADQAVRGNMRHCSADSTVCGDARHAFSHVSICSAGTGIPANNTIRPHFPQSDRPCCDSENRQLFHDTLTLTIPQAKLWWSNGLGDPYLYHIEFTLYAPDGTPLQTVTQDYGIRSISLREDALSETESGFTFVLNGVPVFCKGANHVPADCLPGRITDEKTNALVALAAQSHMNMLRVWGGGFYESETFMRACDRSGIMVWHDFMFACGYYPDHDPDFTARVKEEAVLAIRRLRRHSSLIGWSGNNEIQEMYRGMMTYDPLARPYGMKLFQEVLPGLVKKYCPDRIYRESSPFGGDDPAGSERGDQHIWHFTHRPQFEHYLDLVHFTDFPVKFLSEFGIIGAMSLESTKRSIPSLWKQDGGLCRKADADSTLSQHNAKCHIGTGTGQTDANGTFPWHDRALFEPDRDSSAWLHHCNTSSDHRILQLVLDAYFPHTEEMGIQEYILKSQALQAELTKYLYEEFRRRKFVCSGLLFWTLSDSWGIHNWSLIDYYLDKKPIYYALKRAMAPIAVSIKGFCPQSFEGIQSYRKYFTKTPDDLEIWLSNDTLHEENVCVRYTILTFDGVVIQSGEQQAALPANISTAVMAVPVCGLITEPERTVMHAEVYQNDIMLSDAHYLFAPYKELDLTPANIRYHVEKTTESATLRLTLCADRFVWMLHIGGTDRFDVSDNDFHMLPEHEYTVTVRTNESSLSGDLRGSVHEPLRVGQDSRHAILQNTLSADSFIPQLHSAGTEPALL